MWSCRGGRRKGLLCTALPQVFGVVLLSLCTVAVTAREFSVLVLPWLSFGGSPLPNLEMLASFTVLPLAMKHFNERNGSVLPWLANYPCNATLGMVGGAMYDDEGISSTAMAILVSALSEGSVDFMHGPARSDVIQTVAITAGALNLPVMSFISTSQALSNRAQYPTLFRNVASDEMYMNYLADLLVRYKYKVIGVIHSSDAYGTSGRDSLAQACEERKIRMRAVIFDPNAVGRVLQDQMDRALGVLVGEKLNIIFRLTVTVDHEKAIARSAVKLNWVKGKLHIGRIPTTLADVLKSDESPSKEVATFLAGTLNMITVLPQTSAMEQMAHAWRSLDIAFINQYMPNGTMRSGQSYKLPSDFISKRNKDMNRNYALAYDSMIALGVAACGPSTDLTTNLRQARFMGVSGEFGFSARQTPDQKQVEFLLQNYVPDTSPGEHLALKMVHVGRVRDGNWTFLQDALFNDGSTVPPSDVDRPENVIEVLPLGAKIFGWVEAALALLASLWALSQAPRLGRTRVSRSGRPDVVPNSSASETEGDHPMSVLTSTAMLIFLGLAATSMAVSIILLTLESEVGCMPFFWLCAPGFVLALASLSARAIEIWAFSKSKTTSGKKDKLDSVQQADSSIGSGHGQFGNEVGPNQDHSSAGFASGSNPPMMTISQVSSKSAESSKPTNPETSGSSDDGAGSRSSEAPGTSTVPEGTTPNSSFVVDADTQQQLMRRRSLGDESGMTTLKPRSWRSFCAFIGGIALLVGVCLAILTAWQVVAPFVYSLVVLQTDANEEFPLASVVTCVESNSSSTAFFISMLCLIGALAIFTLMSALCVRNTSSLEARMTTVASLCVFQVFFVGVPTAAAVWRTALSRFLVLSSITFVICMVIVCTMFLPRALSWRPRTFAMFPLRSSPYTPSRLVSGMSSANPTGPRSVAVQQPTILRSKPVMTVFMNDYTRSVKFAAGSYGAEDGAAQQGEYAGQNNQQGRDPFPVQSPAQTFHQRSGLANFESLSMAPKKLPGFVNLGQIDFSVVPSAPTRLHGLALGEMGTPGEVNSEPEAEKDSFTAPSFLAPASLFPAPELFPHAPPALLPGPPQSDMHAPGGATSVNGGQLAPQSQSGTSAEQTANGDVARGLALV